ncbi:MAG TPA: restriction endonuclease [Micromonosporaceae bacterium]|nr:restriction endonuclease [Micromonosporaceae bacterium]
MTVIRLREGALWQEISLSGSQASILASTGVTAVTPGPRPGLWRVRDNGLVGAARFGTGSDAIDVRITPKIAVSRLLFLLGYAQRPGAWRQEDVDAGEHPELLPAVGHAFARAADRALRQGVLLGYRQLDEALPIVRGRIREADQMRRHHGLPLPVEVRFDDYTTDIPENQLLLAAGNRLQRLPGLPADTAKLIRHTLARLAGVSRLTPGHPFPAWQPTRLNQRYHTALWLADLVLRGASYELDDGTPIRVDGLLLRMWQVFEDFVTVAVAEALHPYGGRSQRQDKRHHLDHARRVQLRPDLVYYRADDTGRETPAAVLDAKYKIETIAGGDNPDLYQMLAYSTVLRLDQGHLVYAKGPVEPVHHHLHGNDITVLQHALDLDQHPSDLLSQIDDIAAQIAVTTPRSTVR